VSAPAAGRVRSWVRGWTAAGGVGVWTQLWRGVVAYRVAALVYAVALTLGVRGRFAHPAAALAVLGGMVLWTAVLTAANSRDRGRVWPLVLADHVVCAVLTLASIPVQGGTEIAAGAPTLTTAWAAAPVLSSALLGGPWGGLAGALVQGAASVAVRGDVTRATLGNIVLLLLAGGVGGYVARLAVAAERRLAEAVRLAAAARERERLARGIHDGVLQVLALVRRRGTELGGAAGELAVLAGEQETALRTLITTPPPAVPGEVVDLRGLVGVRRSAAVIVSGPAEPVLLPGDVAAELAAAVAAALDNVAGHGGGRAWVLVEDLGGEVAVSVRDEGPGIAPGRLEQAEADGRLGVASSMRGRISDLGGTMSVHTVPGEGTEVEFRVPRGGH
jgi:signal transduction histidine kinase